MPRLRVPRSTRTMYGTVTPCDVVVDATGAAGVVPVTYGWKHELAGVVGFGLAIVGVGSGSEKEQPPSPGATETAVLARDPSVTSVAVWPAQRRAAADEVRSVGQGREGRARGRRVVAAAGSEDDRNDAGGKCRRQGACVLQNLSPGWPVGRAGESCGLHRAAEIATRVSG